MRCCSTSVLFFLIQFFKFYKLLSKSFHKLCYERIQDPPRNVPAETSPSKTSPPKRPRQNVPAKTSPPKRPRQNVPGTKRPLPKRPHNDIF